MPSEQEILVNFIGSNYGIMKKLDDQIIGSSSTLGRRSDDIKKVLNEVVAVPTQQQFVPPNVVIHQPTIPAAQQQFVQQIPQPPKPPENDNQLWLDFKERDKVYDLLDSIIETQKIILKKLEKLETQSIIPRKKGL